MSRILFIITQSEIGGAQRFLLEFAPFLASKGHQITLAAGEGDGELFTKLESGIMNPELRTCRIPHLVRNLNPFSDIKALFSILKIIKKERPDIVFLQSTKAGFLGSLAAKLYNIRVVYRIGGWSFRDPRSWWMNKILFWMEKMSTPWKDIIIVNSELDRQVAIDRKIAPSDKLVKIYNGIDADKFEFLSKEKAVEKLVQYTKYNPPAGGQNTKIIGTIANLYATKGIEYLIEAVNILYNIQHTTYPPTGDLPQGDNIQFVVIGEGKERPKLEALIKKYNLEDKFFLIGRVPNATRYLKAFDILVLPSVKEGFPWVLLEAMAAEVPIISTKVGAVPEVIEDGKEGMLVPPKDSAALAEKISQLLSMPPSCPAESPIKNREQIAINASEKLRQFSSKKMLRDSEEIINGLTG